ncbi:MAG: ABC transporter ATP-binding protein [Clostridia bacterium]
MNEKISFKERISITLRAKDTIKEYCPNLMQTIFIQAIVTALQPFATIWFSAQIINELTKGDNLKLVVFYAVVVVLLNYIISIIKGRVDILQSERESQMWSYFDKIFTDKLLSLDFADLENSEIQKQKARARENLFTFGNGLAQFIWTINSTIQAIVSITVSIFMTVNLFASKSDNMFLNSPIWILVLIMLILFSGLINAKLFQKNDTLFNKWCDTTVVFNRLFKFFGFTICKENDRAKDVRIYRQDILADKELYRLEKTANKDKTYQFQTSMNEFLASLSIGVSNICCYMFVVLKSFYGAFEVGSVIGYVAVLARFTNGLQQLIFGLTDNAIYTVHLKKLFDFLDIPNKKYQGTLPVEKRYMCNDGDNDYEIEFKNVSFKYPNTTVYVLKNLNFKLKIGKKLAVVGMNGSGKTTMIKLLTRLYDPTEGEILLNGIDIKKYDYKEYMSIFGVVFQDFKLFAFTLGQNVACSTEYDSKKVKDCLIKSGLSQRLAKMPKGIDTCIYKNFEEDGVEISGGEAQKIALARALYKDAPFIILDEPTAALDPLAEFEIYSKFNEIVGEKTTVYISHRLSSCKFCDNIAVFDKGELIDQGTHEELLSNENGKYTELWHAQAQYYN